MTPVAAGSTLFREALYSAKVVRQKEKIDNKLKMVEFKMDRIPTPRNVLPILLLEAISPLSDNLVDDVRPFPHRSHFPSV